MPLDSDPHGPCLIPPWLGLDDLLMLGAFVDLRRLDLNLQLFYYLESPLPGNWKSEGDAVRQRILPQVYTHPSIEFRLNTRALYTLDTMRTYFYSQ